MSATLTDELLTATGQHCHRYDFVTRMEAEADAHGWARIGMVTDGTGALLEDGEGWHQHETDAVRAQSNWQAACRIMADAAGECGTLWDATGDGLMYDADSFLASDAARRIADSLAGYPLLDEDDHSAREWAAMVEEIEGSPLTLPDGVDGEDVLRELSCPSLGEITTTMVEDVLSGMGYVECSDCSEWLTPVDARSGEPLCRDCALEESRPATTTTLPIPGAAPWRAYTVYGHGEPLTAVLTPYLDGYATEQGAAYREDVRAIVRGSRQGYRAVYGRAA
ncbi:hypothetical protein GCM10009639_47600 [Kitasatospora putterlickiae]|uniref:Uncharacterized protein n=1 Tax=Kitasatospora putterlickiae TaxID=221725 RepID=A0ABP4J3T5_9ACTN